MLKGSLFRKQLLLWISNKIYDGPSYEGYQEATHDCIRDITTHNLWQENRSLFVLPESLMEEFGGSFDYEYFRVSLMKYTFRAMWWNYALGKSSITL